MATQGINQFTPFMAGNPYMSGLATMRAAYSQDLPGLIYAAGGGPVPIQSYPLFNPLGNFLQGGVTLPAYQSMGFPQQYTGSTTGFGQIQIFPPGAVTGAGNSLAGIPTSGGGTGIINGNTNTGLFGVPQTTNPFAVPQQGNFNFGIPQVGQQQQFAPQQQQQIAFPQQQQQFPQQQQQGILPGQFSFLG